MVTDVVSTGFADSERCLDSHKITTVTLNEIRGARSSHFSSLLWSKGKCSRLTYANRSLNPMQRHWFNFFFFSDLSRYLFLFWDSFLKRIQFFSLRIKIYYCKELLTNFILFFDKLLFLECNIFSFVIY